MGIVLAGGLSARMGRDKRGLRLFGDNEQDLLTRSAVLLSAVTSEVWISVRGPSSYDKEYATLCDQVEGMGPLGGIMTALRVAQGPVMVLSCDMPFMERGILERLLVAHQGRPSDALMTTYVQQETGYIEALVAVYEFGALKWFEKASGHGIYKLSRVVPHQWQHRVAYRREEALPFFNMNYPADLEMARRLIQTLGA